MSEQGILEQLEEENIVVAPDLSRILALL